MRLWLQRHDAHSESANRPAITRDGHVYLWLYPLAVSGVARQADTQHKKPCLRRVSCVAVFRMAPDEKTTDELNYLRESERSDL